MKKTKLGKKSIALIVTTFLVITAIMLVFTVGNTISPAEAQGIQPNSITQLDFANRHISVRYVSGTVDSNNNDSQITMQLGIQPVPQGQSLFRVNDTRVFGRSGIMTLVHSDHVNHLQVYVWFDHAGRFFKTGTALSSIPGIYQINW
ncbi:MAG: hypothetical protein FWE03_02925 [Firmicutes bacterium]|nr:hypothetical protein [Bacillota bacterium]